MKHYLPIPFLDANALETPDVSGWAHRFGWHMKAYETHGLQIVRFGGETHMLRVTIAPWVPKDPRATAELTVTSGATLIYDDATGCMGVSFEPEPEDAVPSEPKDAEPPRASATDVGSKRRRRARAAG